VDVNKFKDAFVEGFYQRISDMTPDEREQVKKGKDVVLDLIGAVGAFVDVADTYVDKAIEVVEGLYVDIKDDTAPEGPVQPKADISTLNTLYTYLYRVESNRYYWEVMNLSDFHSNKESQQGLVDLYNKVIVKLQDVSDIAYRTSLGLSESGYTL